jgi:pimeloyl-[acyl-carrier protein] synthase
MSANLSAPLIDFSKVEQLGNRIIGQINALREISPICWVETEQSWVISGHAEVLEAYSGNLPLSAARYKLLNYIVPDEAERNRLLPNTMKYFPHFLIMLDPPQHSAVRRLLMKPFSKKMAEDYRPTARQVIRGVLDGIKGRSQVEFVEEVGRQITARNIMRVMGFTDEEFFLPKLKEWAYLANAAGSGRPNRDILVRNDRAFGEMAEAFMPEIEKRRRNPNDDFLSSLVNASESGVSFSDDELVGELMLILLAGHDTTLNTMALSINALSKDRAAREYLLEHPENLLNSILELMRYIAMSTSQGRIVAEDFEWKGHRFKQGQIVTIMTAGANRDPRVFAEPERLDLTRNQDANVTFGPGTHHCIGHLFAKMQLTEFFPEFLRRYSGFEVLDEELHFGGGLTFRGPQSMQLQLTPRAA